MRDSFDAVKTLRQFASGFDDLSERLFPNRLLVISAGFEFLPPRIEFIETREDPLLKGTIISIRYILRHLFTHKFFSTEIMNSHAPPFKQQRDEK